MKTKTETSHYLVLCDCGIYDGPFKTLEEAEGNCDGECECCGEPFYIDKEVFVEFE